MSNQVDQSRIEEMLNLVSSENKEGYVPSAIYSCLRSMKPTKDEAEAASRIARNRELESANIAAGLEQKRDQLTSAINAINYNKDLDAAIKQKVELSGQLEVVKSLIENDNATFKPTYKTDMIFAAIDAIKALSIIGSKHEELDAMIVKMADLWNEIRALSFKGQSSVAETVGAHELDEYVKRKSYGLTR